MIFKLGHVEDVESLAIKDADVRSSVQDYLEILDNAYGKDRNIDEDDGGYVLYCTEGTDLSEVEKYFDFNSLVPEWVSHFDCKPKYLAVLYLLSSDYAIVVVITEKDYIKEN